jgi:hypothetical protein
MRRQEDNIMAQNRIRITGVDEVLRTLGRAGAEALADEIDGIVERNTLSMVNDARQNAPRKTGNLANSIDIVDQETKPMQRTFGSDVPYATRQEYEHASKKGFMRKAVWNGRTPLRNEINDAIRRAGR